MVARTHTTILSAFALFAILSHAQAADTLADMDIEVSPELQAQGIDPGEKHMAINGRWQAVNAMGIVALAAILSQTNGPVVIIGDSIMAEIGPMPGILNLAVPGATTEDILANQVPKIPPNAREVIVEGSPNNWATTHHSQDQIVSDYRLILTKLPPDAQVRLIGILPINDARGPTTISGPISNAQIAATNAQLDKLCTGQCRVVSASYIPGPDGVHSPTSARAVAQGALH